MTAPAAAEYLVRQKIAPVANIYAIHAGHDGEQGLLAYVRQKRFKLREEINFFADEGQQRPIFQVKARKVIDLGSRYDVLDPAGRRIGVFGKDFTSSLARSTWVIYTPDESAEVLRVRERSQGIAVFRRIWDFLPYVGDLPFPIRYHFDMVDHGGRVVAGYDKITLFRDHYRLTLHERLPVDLRVLHGLAVALDALQSR
jgi:hypothetical protein